MSLSVFKISSRITMIAGISLAVPALVMAQDKGVTIYGRAHATLDFLDNGADSDLNVSSNSSRIGIRASTDIAEGLKGIMQLESTISYDNGSGSLANRDTFVGLEGAFGRIRLGQMDTPLKQIRGAVDFFGDQLGDARNLTRLNNSTGAPYTGQDFDARFKNSIYYNTPSFGDGFVFNLNYTPQVDTAVNLDGEAAAYSTSLTYAKSGFYAALAYEQWEPVDDSNTIRLGLRYTNGDLTLAGLLQRADIKNLPVAEDVLTFGLGASYAISSKILVKGQIYSLDAKDREDSSATLAAVGADYILSKQFRLLFVYARADNEDLATYRVTGGGGYGDGVNTAVGETASGLSAGFRYDF